MRIVHRLVVPVLVCLSLGFALAASPASGPDRVAVGGALTPTSWLPVAARDFAIPTSTPTITPTPLPTPTSTPKPTVSWLEYLNAYRTMAKLPAVTENPTLSDGDSKHAIYMVETGRIEHTEIASQWSTPEGLAAAQSSNIWGTNLPTTTDAEAIDRWMGAPFHAVGMLDPALQQVGYGSYRDADAPTRSVKMAAALDVIRGLGTAPSDLSYPIAWPGSGAVVPIASYLGEYPNALSACPGYTAPAGLPVYLMLDRNGLATSVTGSSFKQGDTLLDSCVYDGNTYTNSDATAQDLGRAILAARRAIVLIPRKPLLPGASYTASITANGQTATWSFSVAN